MERIVKLMKRALELFCIGFEWVIDLQFFTPVFCGLVVFGMVLFTGSVMYDDHKDKAKLQNEIDFLNRVCRKAGDSVDLGHGYELRTVYECPDGQIHIR